MTLRFSYLNKFLFIFLWRQICIDEMILFQSGFSQKNKPPGEAGSEGFSQSFDPYAILGAGYTMYVGQLCLCPELENEVSGHVVRNGMWI